MKNPKEYINSNLVGFGNILEFCRHNNVSNFIYASSSSVYGGNKKIPFSVNDNTDNPISIYAASKKSNELIAHTYTHLYNLNTTGLRFFTVYGPWGRPDMAPMIFANAIIKNKPIEIFNYGSMSRSFTYIDDAIEGMIMASQKREALGEAFNIGNNIFSINPDKIIIGNVCEKSNGLASDGRGPTAELLHTSCSSMDFC